MLKVITGVNLRRVGRLICAVPLVVFGAGSVLLSGCGQVDAPTATPTLPTVFEEPVLETGPTPVVLSLVYQDDFSDQASGWDDAFDESTLKQYGALKYHIEVRKPNLFAWGLANRDITDFVLEVTTQQWEGPNNNSYGVIFRLQDKDNFYRFDITGDGFFLLSKFVNARWLTLVDWTLSPAINTGQAENALRVSALGPKISVYANGQLLAEVEDDSFRHGDIGFFAGTFNEPGSHISFDDLRVWAPPGAEIAMKPTATPTITAPPLLTDTPIASPQPQPTATYAVVEAMPTPDSIISTTVPVSPQPTATIGRIAQGQPTATAMVSKTISPTLLLAPTPLVETIITPTILATVTPVSILPTVTATQTLTVPGGQSILVPENLPGYVSAVQPKPKEAGKLEGQIAYPVFDAARGTYDVYIVNMADREPSLLQREASQPALSPDGKQIAFRSWDSISLGLLYRSVSSSGLRTIVIREEAAHPIWAPTPKTFFFHSREEADRAPRLYKAEGEATNLLRYDGGGIVGESPSLLGTDHLVYKGCIGGSCGLMRVPLGGGEPKQLTAEMTDYAPSASPNGKKIAFMSQRAGNWDVYVMNDDGTGLELLTPDASNEGLPAWSPDGLAIAFLSDRNGVWGLWVMNADGSNQYQLLQLPGPPDGRVRMALDYNSVGWVEEQISWSP